MSSVFMVNLGIESHIRYDQALINDINSEAPSIMNNGFILDESHVSFDNSVIVPDGQSIRNNETMSTLQMRTNFS